MATGLKSRIAYKTPTASATSGDYWAGTYKLLIRAKTIPSPFGSQNMVDTSTLEDLVETQEMGLSFFMVQTEKVQRVSALLSVRSHSPQVRLPMTT